MAAVRRFPAWGILQIRPDFGRSVQGQDDFDDTNWGSSFRLENQSYSLSHGSVCTYETAAPGIENAQSNLSAAAFAQASLLPLTETYPQCAR